MQKLRYYYRILKNYPESANHQNLMGLFYTQNHICVNIFMKILSVFFLKICTKLWKSALCRNVEEVSHKKILDPDPAKLVHRFICGNYSDQQFYLKLLTDKQTK